MIVLDASAAIEWLLGRPLGAGVADRLDEPEQSVHIPRLWLVEVMQVLRRFVAAGTIEVDRATVAVADATDLPADRYPHEPLAPRVWQLRQNLTAYDATYIALAEALEAPLLTTDARLSRAPGHHAEVALIS